SYAHDKHIDLGGSFNGPLIHIEMKHINMSTSLKIFPSTILIPFRERRKNYKGHHKNSPRIDIKYNDEDRVLTDFTAKHPNYEFYCKSEDEAKSFLTPQLLKFVAFFYAKYGDKNIFISFNQNKCYLALAEVDKKNLFDTDTYLKNNIVEGQFANQIHRDAQLVNQLMKEITLINAV
ncbi:MAG: DUF3137 domain-containing protein, partial [Cyclobacteriaceae bacterium]|nr:DUF3137 domain-containing protein [Cyclobacteriaceae bacterium]